MTYTAQDGTTWREPTTEELRSGPVRELVESVLESWAPNHMSESGRVTSYDEWIDRVEGTEFPGSFDRISLGDQYDEHPWTTVKKIARQIAADLR